MNWNKEAKLSYETAIKNGFKFDSIEKLKIDIVGEFDEALAHGENWFQGSDHEESIMWLDPEFVCVDTYLGYLAETPEMELIDVILRTASVAYKVNLNLSPCRFSELAVNRIDECKTIEDLKFICESLLSLNHYFAVIDCVYQWMKLRGINVDWFLRVKQNYNKVRVY